MADWISDLQQRDAAKTEQERLGAADRQRRLAQEADRLRPVRDRLSPVLDKAKADLKEGLGLDLLLGSSDRMLVISMHKVNQGSGLSVRFPQLDHLWLEISDARPADDSVRIEMGCYELYMPPPEDSVSLETRLESSHESRTTTLDIRSPVDFLATGDLQPFLAWLVGRARGEYPPLPEGRTVDWDKASKEREERARRIPGRKASFSLTAGILGILLSPVPGVVFVAAPLAIVFGIKALHELDKMETRHRKRAGWGIGLGIFLCLVILLTVIAYVVK
jgi:hypothetical protein